MLSTIPSASSYILSSREQILRWKTHLGEVTKPRIGLVWSGSTTHKNDQNRSLSLSQILPYLSSDYEYISLQKEIRDIDKDALTVGVTIKHFGDSLRDFTDTAALCELMDIVISVDSSVAHLAGALGKPTWILLPFNPDWRWLLDRDDSPWYSSVRLYRQPNIGDWKSVLEKVYSDLSKLNNQKT